MSKNLINNPRLLQEVLLDLGTLYYPRPVEEDVDVFSEPRGVVVPNGLGVSEG